MLYTAQQVQSQRQIRPSGASVSLRYTRPASTSLVSSGLNTDLLRPEALNLRNARRSASDIDARSTGMKASTPLSDVILTVMLSICILLPKNSQEKRVLVYL